MESPYAKRVRCYDVFKRIIKKSDQLAGYPAFPQRTLEATSIGLDRFKQMRRECYIEVLSQAV